MTNIITLIRPEGIWQSSDNRVTLKDGSIVDDDAPKQLYIAFPPQPGGPQMLLAFTGLAEMADGTPTLQWIKETLRGETRTIMESVQHLTDRLTRDLIGSKYRNNPLVLTGGIFEANKRFVFRVSNIGQSWGDIKRKFLYEIQEVNQPFVFISGSGSKAISDEDKSLLRDQLNKRPAKWTDHLGLLAGVNRRIAKLDKLVSPWCDATYLRNGRDGAVGKSFRRSGEAPGTLRVETIFLGIDLSVMASKLSSLMQQPKDNEQGRYSPLPDFGIAGYKSIESRS